MWISSSLSTICWKKLLPCHLCQKSIGCKSAAAKSFQLCLTLCDPRDGSSPGSPVPGILQARTLEWAAISFSNAGKWKVKVKALCRVWLLATPWTVAHQAPPSMGFSRQEYWSGVPLPSLKACNTYSLYIYAYIYGLPRWLSGKRICLPMQETQDQEDLLE